MKKRILALILVVVMSILALTSCGTYNLAEDDFSLYTTFDYEAFKKALGALEIEDDEFTTNEETRAKIVAAAIYNAVADQIVKQTKESERNYIEKDLTAGDVLYFAYYATYRDSDNKVHEFFRSHMDSDKLTASGPINHSIKLGDDFDEEDDSFYFQLQQAVLNNLAGLKPYVTNTKTDLEKKFDEEFATEHDGKSFADLDAAFKEKDTNFKKKFIEDYKAANEGQEPAAEAVDAAYKEFQDTEGKAHEELKKKYEADKKAYLVVEVGQQIVISYTVIHDAPVYKVDSEGKPVLDDNGDPIPEYEADGKTPLTTEVTEKVSYNEITLDANDPLHKVLLNDKAPAHIGDNKFKAYIKDNEDGSPNTNSEFTVKVGDVDYKYKDVVIHWAVEQAAPVETIIKFTPYKTEKKLTPDNLYNTDDTIDLNGKELEFHIFPVYAVTVPTYTEITPTQVLYYIYGSNLTVDTLDVFKEDYKYMDGETEVTVKSLIEEIAKICVNNDTVKIEDLADNDYYKDSDDENKKDDLIDLLKAYQEAVKAGGSNPTGDKKTAITNAKEALEDAQNALRLEVVTKIAAATNADGKILGDQIKSETTAEDGTVTYEGELYDIVYHNEKEAYDSAIKKNVQKALWKLIDESVTIDYDKIPKKLIKQFVNHIHDSYEYKFYEGNFTEASGTTPAVTNYKQYNGSFDAYLINTLKLPTRDKLVKKELNDALRAEACKYLDPIIKVYVVAQACNDDASKNLVSYINSDIAAGMYHHDTEEQRQFLLNTSKTFLTNKEFVKNLKKTLGKEKYNDNVKSYGEINYLMGYQLNNLFNYLTSAEHVAGEDGEHAEVKYVARDTDGDGVADTDFLNFRHITYVFPVEEKPEDENNNQNENN